jgi:hypothetical protein
MINWEKASNKDYIVVKKISNRAWQKVNHLYKNKLDLEMDIIATHVSGCKLNLEKFLGFDEFNFYHDIYGIYDNLDRTTGELQNCFLPRCSNN